QAWRVWPAVALLAVLLAASYVRLWPRINNHDFAVFYRAGQRLRAGESVYADTAAFKAALDNGRFDLKADITWPYAYPPLPAILMVPVTFLPYDVAATGWTLLNIGLLVAGCALVVAALLRFEVSRAFYSAFLVAGALAALIAFYPAEVALRLGQLEIVQFFLIALAFWLLVTDCELSGGAVLGLATALKLFPGALIGLLLWQRRYRAAAAGLVVGLGGLIVGYSAVGWHELPAYLAFTSAYTAGGMLAFPFNQSLTAFWTRNLTFNLFSEPLRGLNLPLLARLLSLASIAAVGLPTVALCWGRLRGWAFALSYALAVTALLLVLPHSQVYGFVWLLLPLLTLLAWLWMHRGRGRWTRVLLSLGLVGLYLLVGRHWVYYRPLVTRLVTAHVTFGTLGLWAFVAAALLHSRGRQPQMLE
ncbi:MAG TPA: hypothetical protein DEP84_12600, partial [Chloroflexi bacterium]|nr:hypothetical protein [Chloroflexota bacterium]